MTKVLNCNDVTTTSLEIMDGKGNYSMFDLMMSSLQFFSCGSLVSIVRLELVLV